MSRINPAVDPDGLLEYSVVFTDRSLNHMSQEFQGVMRDISAALRRVYGAAAAVLVPGGGTFAMEAVARQFGGGKHCLIVRNGLFSFRWTAILDAAGIAERQTVLKARRIEDSPTAPWEPAPIEEVTATIRREKPAVVFAPHVETSAGVLLPDDYIRAVGEAVRAVDGIFVLDCVASGALWVDMAAMNVDVIVSAPQKGWSASPCAGMVMLSERARERVAQATSTSFACDLGAWLRIMDAYEAGGHAYHATMPTDCLQSFRDTIREMEAFGLDNAQRAQRELGAQVRALLAERGFASVAASGFEAPGVVVSYCEEEPPAMARRFAEAGMQIAAGVPLKCDEPEGFRTFRLGLFGLDKLQNVERTVAILRDTLDAMGQGV